MMAPQRDGVLMGPGESLYLDLIRALAALFVVLDHAPTLFDLPDVPRWGHQAVIVFFVLSGYVISYVADTRGDDARAFIVARFARLWSVLVPAMALTILCEVVGRTLGTDQRGFVDVPIDWPLIRVGAVLLFLSETWVSIQPLSNGVVWSLCAEFWYYMLFAAWTFLPPNRTRVVVIVILALLSGFKAILLLPIWLMGVALHRWRAARAIGLWPTVAVTVAGTAVIVWVLSGRTYDAPSDFMRTLTGPWAVHHLAQVKVFWLDWILGIAVTASLFGARRLAGLLPLSRIAPAIRWCAGISFAAYLFHMPLLHLWASFLPPSQGWLAIFLTLSIIALLGPPTERGKRAWQNALTGVAGHLSGIRPVVR